MEHYEIEVCGVRRQLPYIPIKEGLAFASFVIISDTELITACGKELADRIGPVDALVTAEAKGIALAYEVSRQLGVFPQQRLSRMDHYLSELHLY